MSGAKKVAESRAKSGLTQAIDDWCRVNRVSRREIESRSRLPAVVAKRHALMVMLHTEFALSLGHIGRITKKHHTSALYAIRKAGVK